MSEKFVRVILPDELMKKFKAYCAINDVSMTQQVSCLVRDFIKQQNEKIKIIKID